LALFELSARIQKSKATIKPQVRSSAKAYDIMRNVFANQKFEHFWILLLNRANQVIGKVQISEGGVFETAVDPIKVFKNAIQACATGVILFHNHPSNHLNPSNSDIELTKRLSQGAKILNITVLDHLIMGTDSYYSFKDEGILT
jgi:DNA repair protein RadC